MEPSFTIEEDNDVATQRRAKEVETASNNDLLELQIQRQSGASGDVPAIIGK